MFELPKVSKGVDSGLTRLEKKAQIIVLGVAVAMGGAMVGLPSAAQASESQAILSQSSNSTVGAPAITLQSTTPAPSGESTSHDSHYSHASHSSHSSHSSHYSHYSSNYE